MSKQLLHVATLGPPLVDLVYVTETGLQSWSAVLVCSPGQLTAVRLCWLQDSNLASAISDLRAAAEHSPARSDVPGGHRGENRSDSDSLTVTFQLSGDKSWS